MEGARYRRLTSVAISDHDVGNQRYLAAQKTHAIALVAAAKAPYGTILRVLDAAKAAGDAEVSLVMQ